MFNFKHQKTGKIIAPACYAKVPSSQRGNFIATSESATHSYSTRSDDDDVSFSLALVSIAANVLDDTPNTSEGAPSDDGIAFGGFEGGDTDGGGAGGDY